MTDDTSLPVAAAIVSSIVSDGWRGRLGIYNQEAIDSVTGTSLTWKDNTNKSWTFTFSVRRGDTWYKLIDSVDLSDEDVEADDYIYRNQRTVILSFSILDAMMKEVFPDVDDRSLDDIKSA